MRVGLIAPPWYTIPPVSYGGTELVVSELARQLSVRGVEVVLVAREGSTAPGEIRTIPIDTDDIHVGQCLHEMYWSTAAYRLLDDVDLVHDHTVPGGLLARSNGWAGPLVVTNHGPFDETARPVFRAIAGYGAVVAVSRSHGATAGFPVHVIPHGLDIPSYPVGTGRGDYLLFLGRLAPEKGAHLAIEVARRTGRRLVIAAKMKEPREFRYFETVIEPQLGLDVEYVGEAPTAQKIALLADAAALINPIRWPEPFGLVMAEALACATPVLCMRSGAAPEIVADGIVGYVCDEVDELVARARQLHRIDRATCRTWAETHLSSGVTAQRHLDLYERLVASRSDERVLTERLV